MLGENCVEKLRFRTEKHFDFRFLELRKVTRKTSQNLFTPIDYLQIQFFHKKPQSGLNDRLLLGRYHSLRDSDKGCERWDCWLQCATGASHLSARGSYQCETDFRYTRFHNHKQTKSSSGDRKTTSNHSSVCRLGRKRFFLLKRFKKIRHLGKFINKFFLKCNCLCVLFKRDKRIRFYLSNVLLVV